MDTCQLAKCENELGSEPVLVTFTLGTPNVSRTIKVCDQHGRMIRATDSFSIGPHNTLTPIPAYPEGKE